MGELEILLEFTFVFPFPLPRRPSHLDSGCLGHCRKGRGREHVTHRALACDGIRERVCESDWMSPCLEERDGKCMTKRV